MSRTTALAVIATAAIAAVPGTAAAPAQDPPPSQSVVTATAPPPAPKPLPPGCKELVTQREFRSYARRVYRRSTIRTKAYLALDRRRRCAHSRKASRNMLRFHRRQSRARRARLAVLAVTPFPGPNGTRWAVPWPIVDCERDKSLGLGGIWASKNPTSPARGPYQLLGHGEPWPANTPAARLAHHRIARQLYLSSGSGPWTASRHCHGM